MADDSTDRPERRGYPLGQRNPNTLPNGSAGRESYDENERRTAIWRRIVAEASMPGGKYVA